ncbi:N-acetyl-gamma-glutamyl-phosphate reductase, partial [Megasphaera massiliensis]|nr:N-acetyl-gamma-glutamyl-phosphate reductase [Megasphaera massiliensis]
TKKVTAKDVWNILAELFEGGPFIHFLDFGVDKGGFISANDMSDYDDMEILVTGNDQRILVTSLFDNLGK